MVDKTKEVKKISKKINQIINNQSGKILTDYFEDTTEKIDKKWEVKNQISKGLTNYFKKRLKEHSVLVYIRKQEQFINKLLKCKNSDEDNQLKNRLKASKYIRSKRILLSSVQGGGAALAGAPFTLLETFSMLNGIWNKIELTALVFGIKPYTYFEKVYIFYIICISLSDNKEDKINIYKDLIKLEDMIEDKTISLMEQYGHINAETLTKDMVELIRNPLLTSKITQTIPMVGFGFGSITSGKIVQKSLVLAQLLYLRRYLQKLNRNREN